MAVLSAINPYATRTGSAAEVAYAAAYVVNRFTPPDGWSRELAVAVMATMAWRESRLNPSAVGPAACRKGDCHAFGAWQVEHRPDILNDSIGQAMFEYDLIRRSAKLCPAHPLAYVTSGDCKHTKVADQRLKEALDMLHAAGIQ